VLGAGCSGQILIVRVVFVAIIIDSARINNRYRCERDGNLFSYLYGMVCMARMGLLIVAWAVAYAGVGLAQEKEKGAAELAKNLAAKGIAYLKNVGQADDGTFSAQAGPGVTSLVLTGMIRHGTPLTDPSVSKGLKALESFAKPDGGIYGNGRLKNYETCVGILCFAEANRVAGDGRYDQLLAKAKSFLVSLQYDDANAPEYGGVGYGGKGRPDLSNTAFFLEALVALKTDDDDPAVQRALAFVSRCQNLTSPHNDNPLVAKINDGGFFYKIPTEEELESGDRSEIAGGLRSYGSMSYNGLKSMIYAGLTAEDTRVKSATQWIRDNYTLEKNPGMDKAGLFYYFHTFGAALNALGEKPFKDARGSNHDWKRELAQALQSMQGEDGAWQNTNRQWMEDDKNLATAFALLALSYCKD
jgi:squalene-hopene/tetraprenyl-beta-curcumene cyclase